MQLLNISRVSLGIITVIVIAAAIFIVDPLRAQPAVGDQSAGAPTIVRQQPTLDDLFEDFAYYMALQRLGLEQKFQTLSNTAPTILPQQPPIADPPQDFADRNALDQRLQRLEQQIQTINTQMQTLLNIRERAVRIRTETFPKSSVSPNQTSKKYRYPRPHEIGGTALAGETVDANPAARRGITKASGCPASVSCVERRTAPFTAPTAAPQYDEAGNEIK